MKLLKIYIKSNNDYFVCEISCFTVARKLIKIAKYFYCMRGQNHSGTYVIRLYTHVSLSPNKGHQVIEGTISPMFCHPYIVTVNNIHV